MLRCLQSLALCYSKRPSQRGSLVAVSCQQLWKKVWVSVLRMVSAKHHIEQGNCLIAVLLRVSNKFNTFSFLLYVCLSVSHSVSLSFFIVCLSVCLLSYLSGLFDCLSVCQSVCHCLSVCLPAFPV